MAWPVPLAWKNLWHDKRRFLVALLGIAFAVLLMCMQIGFRAALLDSTVRLLQAMNCDIVLVNRLRYALVVQEKFNHRRLVQAEAVSGVKAAHPFYFEVLLWKASDPQYAKQRPIRALAYDTDLPLLNLPEVSAYRTQLRTPGLALMDEYSVVDSYGPVAVGTEAELAGQRIEIIGTFPLGTDFANDGNLIMNTRSFELYVAPLRLNGDALQDVDFGLVQLVPGADRESVLKELRAVLPADVRVLTKAELVAEEQAFWQSATPIGSVFLIGLVIGFVVGVIICYQILYSGIAQHMPEFATLKAMGYTPLYFVSLVLQQSLCLSVLGFIPGALASLLLYRILSAQTGLLLELTWDRALLVLVLTMGMCFVSGCFTIRKVLAADPAELFK